MVAPEGLRHVRVKNAELHYPCTLDEYAEIVWETVEEHFVFVTNLPKYSNGDPNAYGIFKVRRWAKTWSGESFSELVANARLLAEHSDTVVTFENGFPGPVLPASQKKVEEVEKVEDAKKVEEVENVEKVKGVETPAWSSNSQTSQTPQTYQTPQHLPEPKLVLHPEVFDTVESDIEPTRENAWCLFCACTEGSARIDRDRAWVAMCAKFGPHQDDFGPEEWERVMASLRCAVRG